MRIALAISALAVVGTIAVVANILGYLEGMRDARRLIDKHFGERS